MHRHPTEPEIIPPDRSRDRDDWLRERDDPRLDPWGAFQGRTTHRIYVRRIGPVGIFLIALLIGTFAALVFVILLGAVLIWLPVAILLLVAAIVGGLMRRYLRL